LSPAALDYVLRKLPPQDDDNVVVGFQNSDDAGIYQVSPDLALVQTLDFFTPVVDSPFIFGQIAAVNALSDVYAMGGRPITAMAIVCFPERENLDVLAEVMAGGLDKMKEAGCVVIGGHSVKDSEIKFGYSITGLISPERVFANSGAHPGDKLILTKALGTGAITTAAKKGNVPQHWLQSATASMLSLNKSPIEVIYEQKSSVHAVTDISGFGLIGHAREVAIASKVQLRLYTPDIPILCGALECIELGWVPGGTSTNKEFAEKDVEYVSEISPQLQSLLFDPQTAGGLLISVGESDSIQLLKKLQNRGIECSEIGDVVDENRYGSARIL
jgi:selenide, water dikinase